MYELAFDDAKGLVRARINTLLTVEQARSFKADLAQAASLARDRSGMFLLVADTTDAPVQTQDVLEALPRPDDLICGPRDRWAVVVGSALGKLQANRMLLHPQARAFLSANAAETWATAYSGQ